MTEQSMRAPAPETFSFRRIVGNIWRILRRHGLMFALLGLPFICAPEMLMPWLLHLQETPAWKILAPLGIQLFLALVGALWHSWVLLTGASQIVGHSDAPSLSYFPKAVRRIGPIVALAIVYLIGVNLAFLALIIPGVIVALSWAVAKPALIFEDLSVGDAFKRSRFLTRGMRGQIFWLFLLFTVPGAIVSVVGELALGAGKSILLAERVPIVQFGWSPLINLLAALIGTAGGAAIYAETLTVKGRSVAQTAAEVFS